MKNFSRRRFMKDAAASLAGITLAMKGSAKELHSAAPTLSNHEMQAGRGFDLMKEVLKYPKIDSHVHVSLWQKGPEDNIEFLSGWDLRECIFQDRLRQKKRHPKHSSNRMR